MPDQQQWNPISELKEKYPDLSGWSDDRILTTLSDPGKFRSAFPQYASLSDDVIKKNIAKIKSDFTSNINDEGTYRMTSKDGHTIYVPYSRIAGAATAGLTMHQDDRQRYLNDAAADPNLANGTTLPEGVKITGRNSAGQPIFAPVGTAPAGSAAERFLSSVGSAVKGGWEGAVKLVDPRPTEFEKKHPVVSVIAPFADRLIAPQVEQAKEAVEEAKAGNKSLAAGHALAAVTPGAGPWSAQVGEKAGQQAGSGDYAGAAGTVAGNAAVYEAPRIAGFAANTAIQAPNIVRNTVEVMAQTTPTDTKAFAAGVAKKNAQERANVKEANKPITDKTLAERGRTDDVNAKAQQKLDAFNEKKRQEVNAANLKQIETDNKARLETVQKNRENAQTYAEDLAKTKAQNDAALRMEKDRQRLESEYKSSSIRLANKYDAVVKKARSQYNAIWNKWRDKVKDVNVNMTPAVRSISDQEQSMNPQQVSIFRDMLRESRPDPNELTEEERQRNAFMKQQGYAGDYDSLPPDRKSSVDETMRRIGYGTIEDTKGGAVSASRLHGWKSQLERAVRDTQDGTIRYAIGQVLDSVRQLETQASEQAGAGRELEAARAATGPYFEAFFKNPADLPPEAARSLKQLTPEQVKEKAEQDRLDRIAAYDPSIRSLAAHVRNLGDALKTLAKPSDFQDLPAKPQPEKLPDRTPLKEFTSKKLVPKPYKEPYHEKAADITKIGPDELQEHNRENILKEAANIRNIGMRRSIYMLAWSVPTAIITTAMGHPKFAALEVASAPALLYGSYKFTQLLERPDVLKWLTKPSEKQLAALESLPPSERKSFAEGVSPIVGAAQKKGIRVSPAIAAFVTGAAMTQQSTQDREQLRREGILRNPTKVHVTTPDGKEHVFPNQDAADKFMEAAGPGVQVRTGATSSGKLSEPGVQ